MSDGPSRPEHVDEGSEILRAKYHDFCSAQLADVLLTLTPDEIYVLAQRATREGTDPSADPSYAKTVEIATGWLSRRLGLPAFDAWVEDYRRRPEHYDEHMLGLWESEAESSAKPH